MTRIAKFIGAFFGIIAGIVSLPFMLVGVVVGATILTAKAVVKAGAKKEPAVKAKEPSEPEVASPMSMTTWTTGRAGDWSHVPIGRMDKGGTG